MPDHAGQRRRQRRPVGRHRVCPRRRVRQGDDRSGQFIGRPTRLRAVTGRRRDLRERAARRRQRRGLRPVGVQVRGDLGAERTGRRRGRRHQDGGGLQPAPLVQPAGGQRRRRRHHRRTRQAGARRQELLRRSAHGIHDEPGALRQGDQRHQGRRDGQDLCRHRDGVRLHGRGRRAGGQDAARLPDRVGQRDATRRPRIWTPSAAPSPITRSTC